MCTSSMGWVHIIGSISGTWHFASNCLQLPQFCIDKHRAVAIPGHQNCPFMRLRVRSLPWCLAFQWHMSIATCLRFTRTTNTRMVRAFHGGVTFINSRWSLFSKSFSLKLYAQQSASGAFPRKKSFNLVRLFRGNRSQSSTWGITGSINWAWRQSSVWRLRSFLS